MKLPVALSGGRKENSAPETGDQLCLRGRAARRREGTYRHAGRLAYPNAGHLRLLVISNDPEGATMRV